MMSKRLSPDKYTVGWISALSLELAAAIKLLDQRHGRPTPWTKPRGDTNQYFWGSIQEHNIVLAALPEYGTENAATTATMMYNTFPEIRFGLMVGIGAGVPSVENDIRLGDVVISKPGDRTGGVFKFDMNKDEEYGDGNKVRHIGVLNKPPRVLLQAVVALQTKVKMFDIQIPTMLASFDKTMRTEGQYQYQGAENDLLFQADYPHKEGQMDCSRCDRAREESRMKPGRDRSKGPQLFFGTVASGNTVVKSAKRRADIVMLSGKDTMCIEMEAAGLMDSFPCLVIRGICDYADSHKNKRWQNYAALTAAATAKELLLGMDAYHVGKAEKASHVAEDYTPPSTRSPTPIHGPNTERNVDEPGNTQRCLMSIYRGKLNWFHYAIDESVTFILIDGHASMGARLGLYWKWTVDGKGVKNADHIHQTDVRSIDETAPGDFRFLCSDEYYTFDVTSNCMGAELHATMANPGGDSTTFTLDRVDFPQPKEFPAHPTPMIYHGKMDWSEYAVNELFIVALPMGIGKDLPVSGHWQWTTTADGKKKHADNMVGMQRHQINQAGLIDKFRFPQQGSYYQFECTPVNDCRQLITKMSSNGGKWSKTFTLYLQQW